jgi:hypothetical protein
VGAVNPKSGQTADKSGPTALFFATATAAAVNMLSVPHTYRQSGQTPAAVSISFECFGMENTYLLERVEGKPPVWDQRFKWYNDRDFKPKLTGETVRNKC